MSDPDELALARWEVATLTGRLRCVEAERDAALADRDRHQELVATLRGSRSYRLGRALVELTRDPVRTGPTLARRLLRRGPTEKKRRPTPGPVPARVYVAVGLDRDASHALTRALRQRILVDGDHLPVVVTDQPALRGLQVPGVILEYLPDPATWSRHEAGDWETLLAGRVAQLCQDHKAARAVVVDPRNPPTLANLLEPARY
ncbi:hypothetical protein GCM10010172_64050 [Paractinoplanes ferrugineus]|uniref:Uncharacterized protein n=1 Tax=Paractinoplanes ferrugineus TaxID=113564 RepID=A0A919MC49_9ACTN|nr:hypothetical protein [Actinoplanes ferrugineus]GIE09109.1 hypothetical protein Afe05nite_09490 [Actinoplanes ferrugineus]